LDACTATVPPVNCDEAPGSVVSNRSELLYVTINSALLAVIGLSSVSVMGPYPMRVMLLAVNAAFVPIEMVGELINVIEPVEPAAIGA